MAPYKAVVAFYWADEHAVLKDELGITEEGAAQEGALREGPTDEGVLQGGATEEGDAAHPADDGLTARTARLEVEDEIIRGLERHQVFSDFVVADLEAMHQVALEEEADLIVLVMIGDIVRCDAGSTRILGGMTAVEALLWFTTGIGAWFIPDTEFHTTTRVEVAWRRPQSPEGAQAQAVELTTPFDPEVEFKSRERLSTGEPSLCLWDRAKPWSYPWPYLLSFLVPPALVPLRDSEEVELSLEHAALQDIQRDLARKLRGGYVGSAGSPFLFRLEEPRNGEPAPGDGARIRFRYRVQDGFEQHEATGLSALSLFVKKGGEECYELLHEYDDREVRAVNSKISLNQRIEEEVGGLRPGLNLVRFVARSELGKQWITNTVAIPRT